MRDWRGIRAEIGDRVFYATADGAREPKLHEAWVEEAGETHIRVRPTASPFGGMIQAMTTRFAGCIGPKTSLWPRGTAFILTRAVTPRCPRPQRKPPGILPLAGRHEPIARHCPASTTARLSTSPVNSRGLGGCGAPDVEKCS